MHKRTDTPGVIIVTSTSTSLMSAERLPGVDKVPGRVFKNESLKSHVKKYIMKVDRGVHCVLVSVALCSSILS